MYLQNTHPITQLFTFLLLINRNFNVSILGLAEEARLQ